MGVSVEKCLQAWTNSLRQINAKADIVFFGDSLTYYGEFASIIEDRKICNLGLRGDTLSGLKERIEQIVLLNPEIVFLMSGINDLSDHDEEGFEKKYLEIVNSILLRCPRVKLVLQSMLPVNDKSFCISCKHEQILAYNRIVRKIAFNYNLQYADLFSMYEHDGLLPYEDTVDGIHLKGEAYQKWYNYIQKFLR